MEREELNPENTELSSVAVEVSFLLFLSNCWNVDGSKDRNTLMRDPLL